ncbi:MAG: RNA polymerase sigma factor RpoH [Rhodospirillaceae bacterium]|jgi:RNA polymerase sigma-32 factor|nr:RNA polymerase sigma factor RpoH [Rhodospirillaceae bacterium]MBT5373830.1 RNA polymerase sigma factor RpoH [Rhodospirillaceae bacterium]MBT5659280.1 RNA polymerase sigma factor RpoH [Rhodospirillaceae bacterium]MBT5751581.1 RNA polymerase sigma factor RpoH [Rhodospirillaceae bacterium]
MTTLSMSLPTIASGGSLKAYLNEIQTFPLLGRDEEFMLAKRYKEHGETDAAHRMVTSHLRLVAKIARGYQGYGLPLADLISEGNVGLMRAVKGFEPDKGFRLSTYAMWWIRAAITEYVLRSWSMVKIGTVAAQKKLFFGLRKIKESLKIYNSGELSPTDAARIAESMNVPEAEVIEMNRRLSGGDMSLNAPLSDEDAGEHMDFLRDEGPDQEALLGDMEENHLRSQMLVRAMENLNERERHIISERRLSEDPVTLEELAGEYGISRERVRQIEVRAFEKLRAAMTIDVDEDGALGVA